MKRIISILLLLLSFQFACFSQQLFPMYSGLTQLEDKLTSLEDNLLKQQNQITLLEGNLKVAEENLNRANQDLNNAISYSKNLETQLEEALKQSEIVSTSLRSKEISLRVCRITLIVAVPTCFMIGLIVGWNMRGLSS